MFYTTSLWNSINSFTTPSGGGNRISRWTCS